MGWEQLSGATSRIFSAQPNPKVDSTPSTQSTTENPTAKELPFVSPNDTTNPKNVRKLLKVIRSFDFSDVGPSGYIEEGKPDYIKNLQILAMNPTVAASYLKDNDFEVNAPDPLSIVAKKRDLSIGYYFDEPPATEELPTKSQARQQDKKLLDQSVMWTDNNERRHLIDWNQTSIHLNNVLAKSDTPLSDPAKRLVNQTLWKSNQFETPDKVLEAIGDFISVGQSGIDNENFNLLLQQAGIGPGYKPKSISAQGISLIKKGTADETSDTITHTIQFHPNMTRSSFRVNHNLTDQSVENQKPLLENLNIVKYPTGQQTVEQVLWPDLADVLTTGD